MNGLRPGVFLSFSPHDRAVADRLDSVLRRGGVRTAVDRLRELENGLPTEPVLQDLGACDRLVVLWSRAAAQDQVVGVHRDLAASFGKPSLACLLDTDVVPPSADTVLRAAPGDGAALEQRLLAAVHGGRPGPSPAPRGDTVVGPGHWRIEDDGPHPRVLSLQLGADHALRGTERSGPLTGAVSGRWRFDAENAQLDLTLDSAFGLRPVRNDLELQLLAVPGNVTAAEDVHGLASPRRYRLTREAAPTPPDPRP
jgi:hypothetical protein